MADNNTQRYEALARIIKALASPTRLLMVDALGQSDDRCVCELAALIEMDMSTASRHLHQLKEAGIVADEKRGNKVYYHLRNKQVQRFFDFTECCLRNAASN